MLLGGIFDIEGGGLQLENHKLGKSRLCSSSIRLHWMRGRRRRARVEVQWRHSDGEVKNARNGREEGESSEIKKVINRKESSDTCYAIEQMHASSNGRLHGKVLGR